MRSTRTFVCIAALTTSLVSACRYDWPEATTSGPSSDGGHDASSRFDCTGALACDTFDDGPSLSAHWQDRFVAPGGELRIESSVSAPTSPSVLFALRPATTSPPGTAYVTTVATRSLRRASLTFKIRPEVVEAAKRACVAGIVFGDGGPDEHIARVMLGDGRAGLQVRGSVLQTYELTAAPPRGAWSTMTLSVEVAGRILVRLDDATVLDVPVDSSWASSSATRVFVGINFLETPTGGMSFHFDDVRLDGS